MCDICRAVQNGMDPDEARVAYEQNLMDTIVMYGYAITGVDDAEPPYFYTVGRTLQGLPELMISGLDPLRSVAILNTAAEQGLDMSAAGTRVPDLIQPDDYVAGAIACDVDRAELLVAKHMFEPDRTVTALQIVWPDRDNRLPTDDGFTSEFPQPIYLPQGI